MSPRLAAVLQQQVLAKATKEVAPAARKQSGALRVARRSMTSPAPKKKRSTEEESRFTPT